VTGVNPVTDINWHLTWH